MGLLRTDGVIGIDAPSSGVLRQNPQTTSATVKCSVILFLTGPAQFSNETFWITPSATWAQRKVPGYDTRGPFAAATVGNAHGRSRLSETVLLIGSEESEFTQTTVWW